MAAALGVPAYSLGGLTLNACGIFLRASLGWESLVTRCALPPGNRWSRHRETAAADSSVDADSDGKGDLGAC